MPRGDLESVMANKQEVIRSLLQPIKVSLNGDVPTENIPEDFGQESGHVQQRVSSAFELYDGCLLLLDLLPQTLYGFDIDLAAQPVH